MDKTHDEVGFELETEAAVNSLGRACDSLSRDVVDALYYADATTRARWANMAPSDVMAEIAS